MNYQNIFGNGGGEKCFHSEEKEENGRKVFKISEMENSLGFWMRKTKWSNGDLGEWRREFLAQMEDIEWWMYESEKDYFEIILQKFRHWK